MALTRKVKIQPRSIPEPLAPPILPRSARQFMTLMTVTLSDLAITPGVFGETIQRALEDAGFGVRKLEVVETTPINFNHSIPVEDFIDNDEGRD